MSLQLLGQKNIRRRTLNINSGRGDTTFSVPFIVHDVGNNEDCAYENMFILGSLGLQAGVLTIEPALLEPNNNT